MAADYIDIVREVEGYYPLAVGGTNGDETLRKQLVSYANTCLDDLSNTRRWGYGYTRSTFALVNGTASIQAMVGGMDANGVSADFKTVSRVYMVDSAGFPHVLRPIQSKTGDPVYGVPSYGSGDPPRGRPTHFFIDGSGVIRLFPVSDAAYTLVVEGEVPLKKIVETVGTVAAAPTSGVAVPSSLFLLNFPNSLPTASESGASLRGAWYQQYSSGNADLSAIGWTNIAANVVTLDATVPTNVTNAQFFLNSRNWAIAVFPKLVIFGMLRDIASYLKSKDDYKMWESRFQHELEEAISHDNDRLTALETLGVGLAGQNQNALRTLDTMQGYEVRGGVI